MGGFGITNPTPRSFAEFVFAGPLNDFVFFELPECGWSVDMQIFDMKHLLEYLGLRVVFVRDGDLKFAARQTVAKSAGPRGVCHCGVVDGPIPVHASVAAFTLNHELTGDASARTIADIGAGVELVAQSRRHFIKVDSKKPHIPRSAGAWRIMGPH